MTTTSSTLTQDQLSQLKVFTKSCRHSILKMVTKAQSGHPGGSLSSIDFLSTLYLNRVSKTGETVVVSNGHISPAVYSILAELGYVSKEDVVENFRSLGSIFEGHVTRHVPGVTFGTGPLGVGVSAASGFALSEKINKTGKQVFALLGDGEAQEGQVYEMMHFAAKYDLDNFIVLVDKNRVQLTDSLEKVMPIDIESHFKAAGWNILESDGHNFHEINFALDQAIEYKGAPTVIIMNTIMGKGSSLMEPEGEANKATWHGKAPSSEAIKQDINLLKPTPEDQIILDEIKSSLAWNPEKPIFTSPLSSLDIKTGNPKTYPVDQKIDCRSAYGNALLDLADRNKNIIALTADLRGSVKTKALSEKHPDQHFDVGIAEQHMLSCSGGISLSDIIPFCSTFGAFMTSRAKDQARVNDINQTNVKMVATHCGLSVGEDGPTHQAIDDMGSMQGLLNTMVLEPVDANQCDRMIRFIASHYGNFYVRMGRHKFNPVTKEDGSLFYDENYTYKYGKSDLIRKGNDLTIVASGACVSEAIKAVEFIQEDYPGVSIDLIALSSIKVIDENILSSLSKTKNLITVEDHNPVSGIAAVLSQTILKSHIKLNTCENLGVSEYQLSGKWDELYAEAGIDHQSIYTQIESSLNLV
jgi:transketolase